jgi:RIP metalloprotease RseP
MDSFETILRSVWGVSLAVFFFGGTIFIHELGHFLAAKKRGLKVERFSIGFGPRVWGWTGKDGVDYLFPLGGYVALPQMADMSAVEGETVDDAEKLPKIGYADKMIVAVMGATFNVLFAIVIACVLWVFGRPEPVGDNSPVVGYVESEISPTPKGPKVASPAAQAKLQPGDKITAVDGNPVSTFMDIRAAIALGHGRDADGPVVTFDVTRDGKPLPAPVVLHPVLVDLDGNGDTLRMIGFSGAQPLYVNVDDFPNGPPARGGMKTRDRIVSVNGTEILSYKHLSEYLASAGDRPLSVKVEREEKGVVTHPVFTIVPEVVAVTHPLLALEFKERGASRRVELVPVPENPELTKKSLSAPRTKLMVREGVSEDSEYAGVLSTGNILTGVSGSGAATVQNTANFDAVTAATKNLPADMPVTLYFAAGSPTSNVAIKGASFSVVPPETSPFTGFAPMRITENVRQAPWVYVGDSFSSTISTLQSLLSPKSDVNLKHLTGVIGISRLYYGISQNILLVLWFTLVVNVNLAVMNLLPLPVLDGGHMVYATIDKLRGRPLPRRLVEIVQTAFVVLLFGVMAFVLWRDISRLRADGAADRRDLIESFVYRKPDFSKPATAPAEVPVTPISTVAPAAAK